MARPKKREIDMFQPTALNTAKKKEEKKTKCLKFPVSVNHVSARYLGNLAE